MSGTAPIYVQVLVGAGPVFVLAALILSIGWWRRWAVVFGGALLVAGLHAATLLAPPSIRTDSSVAIMLGAVAVSSAGFVVRWRRRA